MKKVLLLFLILNILQISTLATTFTGGVTKVGKNEQNQIIDYKTGKGIEFAKITIPQKNFRTYTDANGNFTLDKIYVAKPMILNVEKEGYRPFSLTINNNDTLSNPLQIQISQSEPMDISINSEILHLGDNRYSSNSANASDFRLKSIGPYFSKEFIMTDNAKRSTNYLVIGSIVGIDTMLAKTMGQNKIRSAFSTPVEVYFNGRQIGEININGDRQRIKIPNNLIKADARNEITIKTGHNVMPSDHIDYDDIEIMNLSILSE